MDEGLQKIIGLCLIGYGALWCFWGYKFFRTLITIYGFFIGAIIGYLLGTIAKEQAATIFFALIGGAGCALLVNMVYNVSIFLIGASLGSFVYQLLGFLAGQQLPSILAIILFVAGGIIALKIVKLAIVLGTSFSGSSTIIIGALLLFGSQYDIQRLFTSRTEYSQLLLMVAGILILGIIGFLHQYKIAFGIPFSTTNVNTHVKSEMNDNKNHSLNTTEKPTNTQATIKSKKQVMDESIQVYCKNCGKKINSKARFCKYCGTENTFGKM